MAADPEGGTDPLGPADPEEAVRAELDRLAGALPALGLAVSGGGAARGPGCGAPRRSAPSSVRDRKGMMRASLMSRSAEG